MSTYWDHKGKYQTFYDETADKLVPDIGKCDTVEGECIRAAARIYYDFYNNGFGNNWSGAFNFLKSKLEHIDGLIPFEVWEDLEYYKCGKMYNHEDDEVSRTANYLEILVDGVLEWVMSSVEYSPNSEDMLDFNVPDQVFWDDYLSEEEIEIRSRWI